MNRNTVIALAIGIGLAIGLGYLAGSTARKYESAPSNVRRLPAAEKAKITGNGEVDDIWEAFKANIYNGSTWTITRLVFTVTLREREKGLMAHLMPNPNATVRWRRDFATNNVTIGSLEMGSIYIQVTDASGRHSTTWSIKEAFGYEGFR